MAAAAASAAASAAAAAPPALPSRLARVGLYRQLLRTASLFHDYNFRHYAQRSVKEKFRAHQHETDPTKLMKIFERAHKDLKMLQRQTLINRLYATGHSILEQHRSFEVPLTSAFNLRAAPAPADAFRQWLAEAAVQGPDDAKQPNAPDHALPAKEAAEREPGQSTRLVADNKGQHSGPAKLEGYSS